MWAVIGEGDDQIIWQWEVIDRLKHLCEEADLMKMDIEGGEQDLLSSNTEWLSRIPVVLAEFHPDRVDYPGLIGKLESAGFVYHRPDHRVLFMDCFTRTRG